MKFRQHQKGFTLYSIAFYLLLLGFVVFTALKLFPVYMESFAIKSSVDSLNSEADAEFTGAREVKAVLLKRFGVNNITTVTNDDITVEREDQTYVVNVNYEVRIPYISNIELVLSFANRAEVNAR